MNQLQVLIFALASAGPGYASGAPFGARPCTVSTASGPGRPLLALIVLQAPHWFRDPFRRRQSISWLLLSSPPSR